MLVLITPNFTKIAKSRNSEINPLARLEKENAIEPLQIHRSAPTGAKKDRMALAKIGLKNKKPR